MRLVKDVGCPGVVECPDVAGLCTMAHRRSTIQQRRRQSMRGAASGLRRSTWVVVLVDIVNSRGACSLLWSRHY